MPILRRLWGLWKAFAHRLGQVQTTIILSVVYLIAIGPISLISRVLGRDLLAQRRHERPSYWVALPEVTSTLERARKQF